MPADVLLNLENEISPVQMACKDFIKMHTIKNIPGSRRIMGRVFRGAL